MEWNPKNSFSYLAIKEYTYNDFRDLLDGKKPTLKIVKNSVFYLYEKAERKAIIVENIDTREQFMITSDPLKQYEKYSAVYARGQNSFGEFEKDRTRISNPEKGEWRVIWVSKK